LVGQTTIANGGRSTTGGGDRGRSNKRGKTEQDEALRTATKGKGGTAEK